MKPIKIIYKFCIAVSKTKTGRADLKALEKLGFARFSSIEVLLFAIRHLIFILVVLFFLR